MVWESNTPVETPAFTFNDAARAASTFIGDEPEAFDRIFLFVPHNEAQRVVRLYPSAAASQ
jgi:hypothetical protein